IAVCDENGAKLTALQPASAIVVRISARAKANLDRPIFGFMFRNHLGQDFAGTNTARESTPLPPLIAGEVCTVDFHIELPLLYPSTFSFSPAIAEGTLEHYSICDWIDNAVALEMEKAQDGPMYGQFHFPCRVEVNARAGVGAAAS
ncbi:MAG: Wzt carbohydrate-binding domain-containing protein, partial [Bryobacteraceae bacterium]